MKWSLTAPWGPVRSILLCHTFLNGKNSNFFKFLTLTSFTRLLIGHRSQVPYWYIFQKPLIKKLRMTPHSFGVMLRHFFYLVTVAWSCDLLPKFFEGHWWNGTKSEMFQFFTFDRRTAEHVRGHQVLNLFGVMFWYMVSYRVTSNYVPPPKN